MKFKDFLNKNSIISKAQNLDPNFWHNFTLILKNSDEISDLLDVPKHKVISWHKKIKDAIDENDKDNTINYKNRLMKTGRFI